MMERGLARRRTSETRMNAQSSRSHAVLTLHLESAMRTDSGLLAVKSSRLNLVDLAGQPIHPEEYSIPLHPRVTLRPGRVRTPWQKIFAPVYLCL